MKKIFTLLLAAGTITFASAQSIGQKAGPFKNNNDSRDMSYGQSHQSGSYGSKTIGYGDYSFSASERDAQIQKINREFAQKIAAVQRDRHLKAKQKTKQVNQLEKQRNDEIKQVQMRFANSKNRYNSKSYGGRKW